jgi:hypothetical protein
VHERHAVKDCGNTQYSRCSIRILNNRRMGLLHTAIKLSGLAVHGESRTRPTLEVSIQKRRRLSPNNSYLLILWTRGKDVSVPIRRNTSHRTRREFQAKVVSLTESLQLRSTHRSRHGSLTRFSISTVPRRPARRALQPELPQRLLLRRRVPVQTLIFRIRAAT